jgi:hypothetical protein
VNAHKVNAGRPPALTGYPDFFWFNSDETEATAALVADIVARRIPARFGLDPRRDVQVLCPMHRGPAGAGNLNLLLQEALTPYREGAPERRHGGRVFRVGDKVTQLRNNYDKGTAGVFNGTTGVVTGMSLEDHALTVRTDEDEEIGYDFDELDELDELAHAYAVTIHRSQGSELPRRRHLADDQRLDDAPAQPALHRHHPREETRRPGRLPPRPRRRRPHRRRRPPPHRPRPPPPGAVSPATAGTAISSPIVRFMIVLPPKNPGIYPPANRLP